MKITERLRILAAYCTKEVKLADIGCDHAYLLIYLKQRKIGQTLVGTEISSYSFQKASQNLKRFGFQNQIKLYLTDGLKGVNEDLDTLVLAGLGAAKIIKILTAYNHLNRIQNLIIQSSNHPELIRQYLNSQGFYLVEERFISEKQKDYLIMKAIRSERRNNEIEIMIGCYHPLNKRNYQTQILKYQTILNQIPVNYHYQIKILNQKIKYLQQYLVKKKRENWNLIPFLVGYLIVEDEKFFLIHQFQN